MCCGANQSCNAPVNSTLNAWTSLVTRPARAAPPPRQAVAAAAAHQCAAVQRSEHAVRASSHSVELVDRHSASLGEQGDAARGCSLAASDLAQLSSPSPAESSLRWPPTQRSAACVSRRRTAAAAGTLAAAPSRPACGSLQGEALQLVPCPGMDSADCDLLHNSH